MRCRDNALTSVISFREQLDRYSICFFFGRHYLQISSSTCMFYLRFIDKSDIAFIMVIVDNKEYFNNKTEVLSKFHLYGKISLGH